MWRLVSGETWLITYKISGPEFLY